MPAERLYLLLSLLLISCGDGVVRAAGEEGGVPAGEEGGVPAGEEAGVPVPSAAGDNAMATAATSASVTGEAALQTQAHLTAEPPFALRVLVRDEATRWPVGGAWVAVYANHTLSSWARSGERGEALLRVPYRPGHSLTLLASRDGYLPTPLVWTPAKRPLFSSVTLLLLPQNQGNIWLFEDSVLVTGKLISEVSSSQPSVQFPKSLLALPVNSSVSSLTAFLTVPLHTLAKDCGNCTVGAVRSKTGSRRSVRLKAVAAVSAGLFSDGQEVRVTGPVQISLPLAEPTTLRPSDTVPAWALNAETGAWESQGQGVVKMVSGHLVWTYTASHLGYWLAASLPSSNDYMMGHASSLDFISYHSYLLLGILGGTLAIVIGFLSVLLCHCGGSRREPRRRTVRFSKLAVGRKDQTTSTHAEEAFHPGERAHGLASRSGLQCDPSSSPSQRHKANYNIYVEDPGVPGRPAPLYENVGPDRTKGAGPHQSSSHYINSEEVARLRAGSDQNRAGQDVFFQDKLVHIYNQPVANIQAPELFGSQETQPGAGCKSATFPRNGGDGLSDGADGGYTQTLPKNPQAGGGNAQQGGGGGGNSPDQPQALETPPHQGQGPNPGGGGGVWGRYSSLLESSVSVPGTLNEAVGMGAFGGGEQLQGISERTLLELTRAGGKSSSAHPPRAWFVSLDGKPCAQVRHSIIELHQGGGGGGGGGGRHGRHHRPPSSNDTSLDSGVDMNEMLHSIREAGERERPASGGGRAYSFPRRGGGRGGGGDDQDLSSSESGTTATCTPEDPALRNILDGSSGAIPNIPEERDGADTSSAREDSESRGTPPPPRRLRKAREKGGRAEKRGARHVREDRHPAKQSY